MRKLMLSAAAVLLLTPPLAAQAPKQEVDLVLQWSLQKNKEWETCVAGAAARFARGQETVDVILRGAFASCQAHANEAWQAAVAHARACCQMDDVKFGLEIWPSYRRVTEDAAIAAILTARAK